MLRIVLSTITDEKTAARVASTLVEERVAACVNVIPKVVSIYRWDGGVENESEALMVLKTAEDRVADLMQRLKELHPYEVPEIVVLDVERGWPPYFDWVLGETRTD